MAEKFTLKSFAMYCMEQSKKQPLTSNTRIGVRKFSKSIRLFDSRLYLDVSNQIKLTIGGDGWIKPRSGFRWFNLGKHHHMTIVSLYLFGWLINLRTPSFADADRG